MKLFIATLIVTTLCFAVSAQTKAPSTPASPFVIKSKTDLDDVIKSYGDAKENQNKDLVAAKGQQMRVAVFYDVNRVNDLYEVHDGADDIYYVLEGKATLILGGELVDPNEISPGEWRAKTIKGGNPFEIKKGDLIVVPRGTVHQRTVTKKGFSMILIKVFQTKQ